jgi:hypothetical protein
MGNMTDDDKIKKFVQETLGCDCPVEVFEKIEKKRDINIKADILLKEKLKVGDRLLIYVIEINDRDYLLNHLAELLYIGKDERDSIDFNRFRLVVVSENTGEFAVLAERIFGSLELNDEKLHLHLITKNEYLAVFN